MAPQALAEAKPTTVEADATARSTGQHPLVLSLASALLLWLAFYPTNWSWLAWGALAPLFSLVRSPRPRLSVYLAAWAGGMVFWTTAISWVRLTDVDAWFAWLVMGLALSPWWPAFLALARLGVLRLRLPLMVAAPVVWVALEFVRAYILTGFPWYYLAHSQHGMLRLIQISDVSGALGISLLIAVVNAWLVDLRTLPIMQSDARGRRVAPGQVARAAVVALALVGTIGYGTFRIATARFHDGPRLALLQSNLEQYRKEARTPEDVQRLLYTYQSLIAKALRQDAKPDLIVWPETSYPNPFVARDPSLTAEQFERQARQYDRRRGADYWTDWQIHALQELHGWTDQIRVPMLVGALSYNFDPSGFSRRNTAILFEPGIRALQVYAKMHLVPFGEYIPLVETLPFLTALTPYRGASIPNLAFGRDPAIFRLGRYRFAVAICFEDTIPQAVRRFFSRPAGGPPDVLVNVSNDGWFHGSSEHDMHLATSVFRAVENRVPLARAVNTGLSALIDGNGKVVAALPKLTEGVLSVIAPLDDRVSLYSAWGDWLGLTCLLSTAALIPAGAVGWLAARKSRCPA